MGSVERSELIKIIARQISREKRLLVVKHRQEEVEDILNLHSHIAVSEASDVTEQLSNVSWQDNGLKNRRSSRIDALEIGNVAKLDGAVDISVIPTTIQHDDIDQVYTPEVHIANSETITSASSGYAILQGVKESTKLLHKSKEISNSVN